MATSLTGPLYVDGAPVQTGLPVGATRTPIPGCRVIWVGSDVASRVPDAQYKATTLFGASGALAQLGARTNKGDIIYVLPGHTENVSAADMGSDQGAASGFSIIGLGVGSLRPAFSWSADAATWLLDTAGIEIANCVLNMAGDPSLTAARTTAAAMTVSGPSCRLVYNYINVGVDADQIVTLGIVTTAAADDFVFAYNTVEGAVAAEITATGTVLRLVGADRAVIKGNYMAAALATDTDGLIETLTTASTLLTIEDNFVYARGAGNTCAIDFGANLACSGVMRRNLLVVDADGTAETVVFTRHATNNMALLDNFLVNDNNERGLVIGTASA